MSHCLKLLVLIILVPARAVGFDSVLMLADSLEAAGFYDEAVTEFRRYLFFNQDGHLRDDVWARIGYCYANMEEWDKAIEASNLAILLAEDDSSAAMHYIDQGLILLASAHFSDARKRFEVVDDLSESRNARKRARILLLLSTVLAHDWQAASQAYRSLDYEDAQDLESLEQVLTEALRAGYKSPDRAMLLSTVLPGAGQIYVGSWLSGLNALVLNGALGYLMVTRFLKEEYVCGILVYHFLFWRYYNGNRYHAHLLATQYNEALDGHYESRMLTILRSAYGLNTIP